VVITDESMDASQLLGHALAGCPQSLRLMYIRSGVPRGAEGASRPGRHFPRGAFSGQNDQINVKKVKFSVKTDK